MLRRPFAAAEGVSNIELFYDLIFVYGISVVTSLCHHLNGDFLDINTWLVYMFSFIVILQVWFFTTMLMNRYGDRSIPEYVGLFVNMFLLYFLANSVRPEWSESSLMFNLVWAGILVNLAIQWIIKLRTYDNLDDRDERTMRWAARTLLLQAVVAAVAAFMPGAARALLSWFALGFGMVIWALSKLYRRKHALFAHVAERCSLLTIIAFGEMVVGISSYMLNMSSLLYPVGVFTLVVGLFLIYIFEHDMMLDHEAETDGMSYMTISMWLIVVIGNLTVAVEYMPMNEVAFLPKSFYLCACLVLYLLTSFLLGIYNKPEFRYSRRYVFGRLAVCAFIVIAGFATSFDPAIGLGCHVFAVWAAFGYEVYLWRRRSSIVTLGRSVSLISDELFRSNMSFTTIAGRREIERLIQERLGEVGQLDEDKQDDGQRSEEEQADGQQAEGEQDGDE